MSRVRQSARNEDCTLRLPTICNFNPETTVYCHTNRLQDGKGMGIKSNKGAYGCSACHDVMDGRAPRPDGMSLDDMESHIDRAVEATDARLTQKGLPTMDDHKKAAHKTAKKLAKGGHSKFGKRKLVSQWAKDMKALIKAGK